MLFNSIHFLIFFPLFVLIFFKTKDKYKWFLLLIGSYYFYMSWNPKYAILIFIATLINYYSAIKIENSKNKLIRKLYLIFSLISTLSFLFFFKYFNFINNSLKDFLNIFSIQFNPIILNILLPVGISFYTFQTIGYTLDVYNKQIKAEKHFGIFALYVSFFPQLVAGPIERAKNLLPQFYKKQKFTIENLSEGSKLMIWGFFLKMVIADRLAIYVNQIYNHIGIYSGFPLIIATYFFAFQIFCDFAGYSFIAIGSAKIMGFNLMENFRRPYFSKSIAEFWRRWHISLSTWLKDYIYIPMGGSRVKISRWYFNIMVVFIISGIWHGAAWTFIFWGFLHGIYILIGKITSKYRSKLLSFTKIKENSKIHNFIKIIITFHLVLFSWIFFRANSFKDAFYIITHLFNNLTINFSNINITFIAANKNIILGILFIILLEIIHLVHENKNYILSNSKFKHLIRLKPLYYLVLVYLILFFGIYSGSNFIYFQF